ncbi:MAG: DUF2303 family protein [Thalassovita sp.]
MDVTPRPQAMPAPATVITAQSDFPLSDEWKAWMQISGAGLGKDELGEFIEAQAGHHGPDPGGF